VRPCPKKTSASSLRSCGGEIAQGSNEGRRAQRALALLLLHPEGLTSEICRELSSLFSPTGRVVIKKQPQPSSREERNRWIVMHIAEFMQTHGRGTFESAVEDTKGRLEKKRGIKLATGTIKEIYTYKRFDFLSVEKKRL
jgi:hypothetical protein